MKRFITLISVCYVIFAAAAGVPQIVAHRGHHAAEGSAQNSIRALVKADSVGSYGCEFDVWISADDKLYVNHDPSINGVVIETSNSQDIDKCHLSNGERIPTLEAFLDTAKSLSTNLVLELKQHRDPAREDLAIQKILKMVAERGLDDRMIYITFSRNAFDKFVVQTKSPVQYLTPIAPAELAAAGGSAADYNINVYRSNPDWIDQLHRLGLEANVWTVDNPDDIRWCIDRGVDYITTNQPETAAQIVAETLAPRTLRIMSYNLRFGERAPLTRIADEIKAQNPDFVALQEVDVNTARQNAGTNMGKNYLTELAQLTGMFGYYGRTINLAGGYYGIGILSRHPATEVKTIDLPNPANVEPRIMLMGRFLLDGHTPILFSSTHLDYIDMRTIERQALYMLPILENQKVPLIVGGDFNSKPSDAPIRLLDSHGIRLSGDAPTFPSNKPKKRIDHIFGFPANAFRLIDTAEGVSSVKAASDHLPVISTVEVDFGTGFNSSGK